MEENSFSKCEKKLTEEDIDVIENRLKIIFPSDFKRHYLLYNGGKPKKTLWVYPNGEWDDIEVRDFIPMRYSKAFGDDPDYTAEGRAIDGWAEKHLPMTLFPFAFDWGGNYFCLNIKDGSISYFIRDVWSDSISTEKNLEINTRPVADSFRVFVAGLALSDD